MLTNPNSATGKKDLHVGGVGADSSAALASVIDPLVDASEDWIRKAKDLANSADEFVRENPWRALGAVALIGVTVGYWLSRGSRS